MNTAPAPVSHVSITHPAAPSDVRTVALPPGGDLAPAWAVADELCARYGVAVPHIAIVQPAAAPVAPVVKLAPAPAAKLAAAPRDRDASEWVDADALARIERDRATAKRAGFSLGVEAYARGTVVNSTGVANAKKERAAFEALPEARAGLAGLVETVRAEERRDERVNVAALRMAADGTLGTIDAGPRWSAEREAFGSLAGAIGVAQPGEVRPAGLASYLASCPPSLRAPNVNAWAELARPDASAVLRTRKDRDGGRGIFAVVSDQYAAVDSDKIAALVSEAVEGMPGDLRARIAYDGRRTMIDVVAHSNVEAESYAAGEVFRAFARITTDDTGGGSIQGHGGIDQNLCRNLIILHHARNAGFRLVHKGSEREIVRAIRRGMGEALASVAAFAPQWSAACAEPLPHMTDAQVKRASDRMLAEILAASLASAVATKAIPVGSGTDGARVREAVPGLLKMWAADRDQESAAVRQHGGATRAAVVNATTRYAHRVNRDAFAADDLERAAGRILAGAGDLRQAGDGDWKAWGTSAADLVRDARIV